jgi:hypothetical protein
MGGGIWEEGGREEVVCTLANILWLNENGAVPPRGVSCAVLCAVCCVLRHLGKLRKRLFYPSYTPEYALPSKFIDKQGTK